jgi:hypothetical protein
MDGDDQVRLVASYDDPAMRTCDEPKVARPTIRVEVFSERICDNGFSF